MQRANVWVTMIASAYKRRFQIYVDQFRSNAVREGQALRIRNVNDLVSPGAM